MIHDETEYQDAVRRLTEEKKSLAAHRQRLEETGLSSPELKRALDPLRSFQAPLEEAIDSYERLRRGDVDPLLNLHGLGRSRHPGELDARSRGTFLLRFQRVGEGIYRDNVVPTDPERCAEA